MQHPSFSRPKTKRTAPILYRGGGTEGQIHALPQYGMAAVWDADRLIWAGGQIVEAADRRRPLPPWRLNDPAGRLASAKDRS